MKRRSIMIESESLDLLRAIKAATGMSEAEQVRRAVRSWLERREWPIQAKSSMRATGQELAESPKIPLKSP